MALLPSDPLSAIGDPSAFKNPEQASYLRRLRDLVSTALLDRPGRSTATDFLILNSPNGTPYRVSITDDGNINATVIVR